METTVEIKTVDGATTMGYFKINHVEIVPVGFYASYVFPLLGTDDCNAGLRCSDGIQISPGAMFICFEWLTQ